MELINEIIVAQQSVAGIDVLDVAGDIALECITIIVNGNSITYCW